MRIVTVPIVAVILGLSLGSASAFQETTIGGGGSATTSKPAAAAAPASRGLPGVAGGGAGTTLMTPSQKKAAEGDNDGGFRIPGLGDLGLLPKMNFGLELLYGQGETRDAVANPQDAPMDELTIRGSVKHNF